MKLLRSLPKEWKPMIVSLRHSHEFKYYTLEKLYWVLRTYELEIQQDEEIEKSQRKDKFVALVAQDKYENKMQSKSETTNTCKQTCEEKKEMSKGKLKVEGTEDITQEEFEEIDEHLAFLSRRLSKLKFKRNPSMSRPPISFRKGNQVGKSLVDR